MNVKTVKTVFGVCMKVQVLPNVELSITFDERGYNAETETTTCTPCDYAIYHKDNLITEYVVGGKQRYVPFDGQLETIIELAESIKRLQSMFAYVESQEEGGDTDASV